MTPSRSPVLKTRELDSINALVAEKVFGATGRMTVYAWSDRVRRERPLTVFASAPHRALQQEFGSFVSEAGEKVPYGFYVPRDWDKSIASAFLVVEQMRERGYWLSLECRPSLADGSVKWCAWFMIITGDGVDSEFIEAASAPHAISLAALSALGFSPPEGVEP